jgi:hypothetical protein
MLLQGLLIYARPPVASAAFGGSTLNAGEYLTSGQWIISPNGQYLLLMASDGNLDLFFWEPTAPNGAQLLWASSGLGAGTWVIMQTDGQLVMYNGLQFKVVAATCCYTGNFLRLQDDANLVVYTSSQVALWSTGTVNSILKTNDRLTSGQYLLSPDRRQQYMMQSDGNLVLYTWPSSGWPLWNSGTAGNSNAYASMSPSGNLSVYSATNVQLWAANPSGSGSNTYLSIQDDGNAVLYNTTGPWNTGTQLCTQSGSNNCNRDTFGVALLSRLVGISVPATGSNVYAIHKWADRENTAALCNPLATTKSEPGSWDFNSVHVKNYQDYQGQTCWYWGVTATKETLVLSFYTAVVSVLTNPSTSWYTQCVNLANAVAASPWGTGNWSSSC